MPTAVALIPARGGSKSVPDKNVRPLGGKPLLAWSVDVAHRVAGIDRVVVSTDSARVAEAARRCGAEVAARPQPLATDDALVADAIRYHLEVWRAEGQAPDVVVLLEPTCPFRTAGDVAACLGLLDRGCDSVATFTEAEVNPWRTWTLQEEAPRPFIGEADPWRPRQALPPAHQLNGGVYAFRAAGLPRTGAGLLFGRVGAVTMPPERSLDLDSELDFIVAEALLEHDQLSH